MTSERLLAPQVWLLPLGLSLILTACLGCATLREVVALRNVEFRIAGVDNPTLAGIDLTQKRSYEDLTVTELGRLAGAVVRRQLPLAFDLQLQARNPAENSTNARLVRMDWTLFLDDTETISGSIDETVVLPPGKPTTIPIAIGLELFQFFDGQAKELAELVLAIAGQGQSTHRVSLRAVPTIDTALGPIRYPQPITILRTEFGP